MLARGAARALGRSSKRTVQHHCSMVSMITFETYDVFTTTPFGGNPLAVVYGADGLATSSLQAIAREFNYSETTFVLPPADLANTARVRIFTPTTELPFAGHPNVGTAFALAQKGNIFGRPVGSELRFEEESGLVPVKLLPSGAAQLEAPMPFSVSAIDEGGVSVPKAAACLGLEPADLQSEGRIASLGGNPYVLVEVREEALGRCVPNTAEIASTSPGKVLVWVDHSAGKAVGDDGERADLSCRMFTGRGTEDAATGAANCCLMALLVTLGRHLPPGGDPSLTGSFSRRIVQGVDMGRPSLLLGECEYSGCSPLAVHVAGQCVPIMQGQIDRSLFETA